jgi:hypothetical protein
MGSARPRPLLLGSGLALPLVLAPPAVAGVGLLLSAVAAAAADGAGDGLTGRRAVPAGTMEPNSHQHLRSHHRMYSSQLLYQLCTGVVVPSPGRQLPLLPNRHARITTGSSFFFPQPLC